jgi:hypothetical protein
MTTGAGHLHSSFDSRRGGPALALVALCAALVLGGCSSGSDDEPSSADSPSASASPSASTSTRAASDRPSKATPPRAPKPTRGPAGQKRFAQHVMALWGYALRNNDPRALVALSAPGQKCRGCKPFAASLRKREKAGWYVDFAGVDVHRVTVKKVDDNVYAKATVDIPESDSYNADGSFRNTNKAHPGATFEVLMHRGDKRFQLLAFTVS